MEITNDLQMTEKENHLLKIVQNEKSIHKHNNNQGGEGDRCRICLEQGNDLINFFKEQYETETPSIVDKLIECSRISQVSIAELFRCVVLRKLLF